MAITAIGAMNNRFIGLSTDTKPTADISAGATFLEYDTKKLYINHDGTYWSLKSTELDPDTVVETATINLKQVAGDYDVIQIGETAETKHSPRVVVKELVAIIPADLTGAAAGALTAISIQSTDGTPVEFISATAGAKANLSGGAHLQYFGGGSVAAPNKIQLTIAGGSTLADQNVYIYMVLGV